MDHEAEIARVMSSFDAFAHRDDTRGLGTSVRRSGRPSTPRRARAIASTTIALVCIAAILGALALLVNGVGLTGLFIAAAVMLAAILFMGFRPQPAARPVAPFREDMPNKAVVQRLGSLLSRHRALLPPAAAARADAISAKLPLLEQRLAGLSPLDPLAQDARRLVGQHLPELIERYERVPALYRGERDGEGKSVDDRLVLGLDAARSAIDDLGRRLSRQDVDEFQTQGRFLESRYRDGELESGT